MEVTDSLKLSDTKITATGHILTSHGPGRLNKMCDLFKNVIQKTCDRVVNISPYFLEIIPDRHKTQEMCNEAVRNNPWALEHVPDQYKAEEMCNKAVRREPYTLWDVPDHFKTQKMCTEAVRK